MKTQIRYRLTILLLCGIFVIYLVFLSLDALHIPSPASDILKYASICLCTLLAFLCASPSRRMLRAAFLLTLVCDALLLFTSIYTPGIMLFCGVHILNGVRMSRTRRRTVIAFAAVCAVVALLSLMPVLRARLTAQERAAAVYTACLLLTLYIAARAAFRRRTPWAWRGFAGQAAFLLCDICVMLFNTLPSGQSALPGILMWFFYVPAQTLLATSEESLGGMGR